MNDCSSWVFFAADAKPNSLGRAIGERLAEKDPVLIVDRPLNVLRDHKVPALEGRCELVSGSKGCWRYRPLYFPEKVPWVGEISQLLNRVFLRREIDQLLPRYRKRIVCYDSPTQERLVGKLKEDLTIYLARDDRTITVCGEPISGELEAEKRLLTKVKKVVCVSETLAETLRLRVPGKQTIPIYVLPNGYDERIFNFAGKYPEPPAIREIPRPRILVAGHVSERIDWEGIKTASELRPEWTWIFIGPAEPGMKEKIRSIFRNRGFCLPPVPVAEIPGWIQHCDACGVPYRLNPFTLASCPLKAIEYLAMGAPLFSTRIPSLERYQELIEWVIEGDGGSYAKALLSLENQKRNYNLMILRQHAVEKDSLLFRGHEFVKRIEN